jgi:YhcH/YjgK/YiaL family protein
MVLDSIKNYGLYTSLGERLAEGYNFINTTDLKAIQEGIHEIDGQSIFAIVQEYDTKEEKDCFLEGHTKYIDIQYMIEGTELMGIVTKGDQKIVSLDVEKDYTFYEGETSYIKVEAGMFTVFFPDDLHRPCLKVGNVTRVKKVVVKVQI